MNQVGRQHMQIPTFPHCLAFGLGLVLTLLGDVSPVTAIQSESGDPIHHSMRPAAEAVRIDTSLNMDGTLSDPAWERARPVMDFIQIAPDEGAPGSQPSEVRVLYDDDALYVGAHLFDSGPVTTRLGRRDMARGDSDWFTVALDSYHDHRTAFVFEVNPSGVLRDAVRSSSGDGNGGISDDESWDAVWTAVTSMHDEGWSVEIRIPFGQLRFASRAEQVWGLQLERVIGRNQERSVFAFTPRSEVGGVQSYGHLTGLRDIETGSPLELLPYAVVRSEHMDPGPNPYRTSSEQFVSGGADLLYRLSSDLTLNATVNPDFGQVEVDPAVVNLGVYETFFEERRPFFVEGSEIFNFGRGTRASDLFYSRRIGRSPQLNPPTPSAERPVETRILGAAKLSGKTDSGWSLGVLDAVTAREHARYRDIEGVDREMLVEPRSNYMVARARRDLRGGQTAIGGIMTGVQRALDSDLATEHLAASAYAIGMDVHHEFADRNWLFRGAIVGSRVAGSPESLVRIQEQGNHYFQRPDATHLSVDSTSTELNGYLASFSLDKQAGLHWLGSIGGAITSPSYEVNDLGFVRRTDRQDLDASVTYQETQPGRFLREWSVQTRARHEMNYVGDRIMAFGVLSAEALTLGYWSAQVNLTRRFRAFDDRNTRGGPIMVRPANSQIRVGVGSDPRSDLLLDVDLQAQEDEYGGSRAEGNFSVRLQSSPNWNLSVGPRVLRARSTAEYIGTIRDPTYAATFGKRYLFADFSHTEVGLDTRFDYTFTPTLTLELYAQPLLSSGSYGDAQSLAAPRTFEFTEYEGEAPNRDFNVRTLRGNAVFRWEWRPGSTLYLVWQQIRSDPGVTGNFDFGRDWTSLLSAPAEHVFSLKASYWINP